MTETITSKYSLFFWAKILLGILFEGFIVFLIFHEGLTNSISNQFVTQNNLMFILIVVIAGIIITLLFPPKRVIVSADHVVFRSYITQRKRKITYPDIDKIRTIRKQKFIRGGDEINYQQLELVLVNGDVYAFNEDDYDNYESLKVAIYDHKFRGQ
jgi:membrane protein insertase Oxa1/YidC/SpoIIIJ